MTLSRVAPHARGQSSALWPLPVLPKNLKPVTLIPKTPRACVCVCVHLKDLGFWVWVLP